MAMNNLPGLYEKIFLAPNIKLLRRPGRRFAHQNEHFLIISKYPPYGHLPVHHAKYTTATPNKTHPPLINNQIIN
jgi:hypothetical protein